jgi:UDP-glucose 4-epimerase
MQGLKTVLVTGANGFFGRHLLARLNSSANVYAVSRSVPERRDGVRWHRGDISDLHWIQELTSQIKPDVIYHLASCSMGAQDVKYVLPNFEDIRGTVNVLLAARQQGCSRVVLTGSMEEPILDGSPLSVASPYSAAKGCEVSYGLLFHQIFGVPVVILRPFMTYGPDQKEYKLIPYAIRSFLEGEAPRLNSGTRLVDWVYVDDVITAFLEAAVNTEAVGAIIELGSGQTRTVREVIELIHQRIPGSPAPHFGALPDRIKEVVRCAETETAARILGWRASTPLSEGLAKTIRSFKTSRSLLSAPG